MTFPIIRQKTCLAVSTVMRVAATVNIIDSLRKLAPISIALLCAEKNEARRDVVVHCTDQRDILCVVQWSDNLSLIPQKVHLHRHFQSMSCLYYKW